MTEQTVNFTRGQAIVLALEVVSGDPAGFTVAAKLKRKRGAGAPPAGAAVVATLTSTFVAAAGDVLAHWLLTVSAEASAALAAGRYVMDAALSSGGAVVQITEPLVVALGESVSA